jgi:hypothetical protein
MLRVCEHSDCGTLTLGRFCVIHEPPPGPERFPRGRPFAQHTLPPLEEGLLGVALEPALLAAAAAEASETEPIRAVFLEGGT